MSVLARKPRERADSALSPTAITALESIAAALRDVPRDCIRDPGELVMWLRKLARRVDGVAAMRAPGVYDRRTAAYSPFRDRSRVRQGRTEHSNHNPDHHHPERQGGSGRDTPSPAKGATGALELT